MVKRVEAELRCLSTAMCTHAQTPPPLLLQTYLFNYRELTDGEPPNDKCCRRCGKIGHRAKDCHLVVQRRERYETGYRAQGARQHRAAVNTGLQPGYSVMATRLGNVTTSDKKMLLNRKR